MTDRELIAYVMLRYLQDHPNALGAILARLQQLDAGTYIPANDPQAGPVLGVVVTLLNNTATAATNLANRVQALASQSTPVL